MHDSGSGNEQTRYIGWDEGGTDMKNESLKKMKTLEQAARQRIIERGKVEFRADQELMGKLLDLATKYKVPVGPMVRQWVQDRAEQEMSSASRAPTQLDKIERKLDRLISDYESGRK